MVVLKKYFFAIIAILIILKLVTALQIEINTKDQFNENESIKISYRLISDINESIEYFLGLYCPDSPIPQLELKKMDLKKYQPFYGEYDFGKIISSSSKECNASLTVIKPYNLNYYKSFKWNKIIKEFNFSIKICKDPSCNQKSKVFVKNEKIYINYESSVQNPLLNTTLIYPDKTSQEIILPGSISPTQIGTYELDVAASKERYKTVSLKNLFGVIEKNADIKTVNLAPLGGEKKIQKNNIINFIILDLIIILIVIISIIALSKKNKK